jgi:hypothetical protein
MENLLSEMLENAVLIFTYIGLKQQEVNVAGKLQ